MIYLLFLILEIIFLFFLSRGISKAFSRFLSIQVISFIFLPGTIIHELSHMLIASILFVRVGDIEFVPKTHGDSLKLGSVAIEKTDPIRRAIIGFAPVLVGIMLVLGIVYVFTENFAFLANIQIYFFVLIVLLFVYVLFVIANTMFSSKKDLEGTVELLIVIAIIFVILYFLGFRIPHSFVQNLLRPEVIVLVQKSSLLLLAPILIDLVILGAIKLYKIFNSKY